MGETAAMPSVLMVCLGNICRSPMAEAVLKHLVARRADATGWRIDSAGTGSWHIGKEPHPLTLAECQRRGVAVDHRARQVERADFARFDFIMAMDRQNLRDLRELVLGEEACAHVSLLGAWDPRGESEVPDPYYSEGSAMYAEVFEQVERCCIGFLGAARAASG
jgi:protein-tyrosine-phosphatase